MLFRSLAERSERLGRVPIGLRDEAYAKATAFEKTGDQHRAERRVIDVGVARDDDDVDCIPPAGRQVGLVGRQKGVLGLLRRVNFKLHQLHLEDKPLFVQFTGMHREKQSVPGGLPAQTHSDQAGHNEAQARGGRVSLGAAGDTEEQEAVGDLDFAHEAQ